MNTLKTVFSILATLILFYGFACSIRIIFSWIPDFKNGFTNFLSKICDPYLDFFDRHTPLYIGEFNFSCIVALAVLSFFSIPFFNLSVSLTMTFASVFALIVTTIEHIGSSILFWFIIILIIRLVILIFQRNSYNGSEFIKRFDYALNPIVYRIARTFTGGKLVSYKATLIISIIALIAAYIIIQIFFIHLIRLIMLIPF
mgnify:FL=1